MPIVAEKVAAPSRVTALPSMAAPINTPAAYVPLAAAAPLAAAPATAASVVVAPAAATAEDKRATSEQIRAFAADLAPLIDSVGDAENELDAAESGRRIEARMTGQTAVDAPNSASEPPVRTGSSVQRRGGLAGIIARTLGHVRRRQAVSNEAAESAFARDPFETWQDLQRRANRWTAEHPGQPLDFPFPEVRDTLHFMIQRLEEMQSRSKSQPYFPLIFHRRLLQELRDIETAGYPYARVLHAANQYTLAISYPSGYVFAEQEFFPFRDLFAQGREWGEGGSIPTIFFIPTHRPLGLREFIRTAAVPVFYLGVVAEPTMADGSLMRPDAFFQHDIAHARFRLDNVFRTQGSNAAADFERRTRILDKLDRKVLGISDRKTREAAVIILFELLHERNVPVDSLRDYLSRSMDISSYLPEIRRKHTRPWLRWRSRRVLESAKAVLLATLSEDQ